MSLSVSRARVKEKCYVTDTSSDLIIDNLISEMVPAIEYSLDPSALSSVEPGLVALLNLGATELVCAEFLAQRYREPGAGDSVTIGSISSEPKLDDATALASQANLRLAPYLRQTNVSSGPRESEE